MASSPTELQRDGSGWQATHLADSLPADPRTRELPTRRGPGSDGSWEQVLDPREGSDRSSEAEAGAATDGPRLHKLVTHMPDLSFESSQTWHKVAGYVAIVAYVVIAAVAAVLAGLFFPIALPVVVLVGGIGIMLPLQIFNSQIAKADALETGAAEERYVQAKLDAWKKPQFERASEKTISLLRQIADDIESTPEDELLRKDLSGQPVLAKKMELLDTAIRDLHLARFPQIEGLDGESMASYDALASQFAQAAQQCGRTIFGDLPRSEAEIITALPGRLREAATALETTMGDIKGAHASTAPSFRELVFEHADALRRTGLTFDDFFFSSQRGGSDLAQLEAEGVDLQQLQAGFARCLYWHEQELRLEDAIEKLYDVIHAKEVEFEQTNVTLREAHHDGDELLSLMHKRSTLDRQITENRARLNQLHLEQAKRRVNCAIYAMYLQHPTLDADPDTIARTFPIHNIAERNLGYTPLYRLCDAKIFTLPDVRHYSVRDLAQQFYAAIAEHNSQKALHARVERRVEEELGHHGAPLAAADQERETRSGRLPDPFDTDEDEILDGEVVTDGDD